MGYQVEIWHDGLKRREIVKAPSDYEVKLKARNKLAQWDVQYKRLQLREHQKNESEARRAYLEIQKSAALKESEDASARIMLARSFLNQITSGFQIPDYRKLLKYAELTDPQPAQPVYDNFPLEPKLDDPQYAVSRTFFDRVLPHLWRKKVRQAKQRFDWAHQTWAGQCFNINNKNLAKEKFYNESLENWKYNTECKTILNRNSDDEFYTLDSGLQAGDAHSIYEYFSGMIKLCNLPEYIKTSFYCYFESTSQILTVDFELPNMEETPNIRSVKYIEARDEIEIVNLRQKEQNELYDEIIYQTTLAVLFIICACDKYNLIKSIGFNGWVDYVNKSTGVDTRACVISIFCTKEDFQKININRVEPKNCVRFLRGVFNSKIYEMIPVKPIISLNRDDRRFVGSAEIIGNLEVGSNLAALGWEEFEHLIREIFAKEFSKDGGEVKITQASRDGGVDAIAFDPDPIRGGKIVIQAKRYTNTVDVSSVRDLYGTVMNEGATKGILVTTSTFGSDSYNFAKDKPITLLDGNNLLYLLEKHGHKATIDLAEAKKLGVGLKR